MLETGKWKQLIGLLGQTWRNGNTLRAHRQVCRISRHIPPSEKEEPTEKRKKEKMEWKSETENKKQQTKVTKMLENPA